jgi:hypothetical protein
VAKKRIHRVPHEAVREILIKHGIDTVSKALAFGDAHPALSGKSIEGILRGRRKLGVEFARVDEILCAVGDPMHWYGELAEWYYPAGCVHDPEYETFLRQGAAFERACEFIEGKEPIGLVFSQ